MKTRKPKESSRKSRKTQAQIRHILQFGLKDKLRCWVLSPLFIGIILTVLISFGTIAYVEPIWFETTGNLIYLDFFDSRIGNEIIVNQKNSMKSIAASIGDYMRQYFQRVNLFLTRHLFSLINFNILDYKRTSLCE